MKDIKIVKKDGTLESFNPDKIKKAVEKSANRINYKLSEHQKNEIANHVKNMMNKESGDSISVAKTHSFVEAALEKFTPEVCKSYREYRNYKLDFVHMLDGVYKKSQSIMYIGDKENSNTDSALVSTKRSLIFNELNKELYKKFFLTTDELQAIREGYIYIHDMSARRDTMNCCLFNVGAVLKDGFEMGNVWYNEPKSLDTAFDVIGDIILSAAAQQYGGFTVPEVDKVLRPYAKKSFEKYKLEFLDMAEKCMDVFESSGNMKLFTHREVVEMKMKSAQELERLSDEYAYKKIERDFAQGYQGWEYKFNTVGSSRGDYPFITITFGLGKSEFEQIFNKTILKVHKNGQGKKGAKRPVLFPKLVFLYDKDLHGPGCCLEDVYEAGIECSAETMYPDWLSLTGDGYVASIYKKYKRVISPMGCRAFLSPWYEKGGIEPADEDDKPVFEGRFNIGAISLHLPMILAKARKESKDFYDVLDYYLEMIRLLHIRTYDYLGEMRASVNPLGFCQGGFYGGDLKYTDKIRPILKSSTASFGITALNELQQLYNKKSITEDGQFALDVMNYINSKIQDFKREDNILYAIYGTPAENLCGLQVEQFRKIYGVIPGVSDRAYVSNSFHCAVWEDITPIEKQDLEGRFWDLLNGGKIQYCKYPLKYNKEAVRTLINRAMDLGYYEGVNLDLSYCDDCGFQGFESDDCPKCGSHNIVKINRMNGYLSYSRVKGDSRLNDAKMEEIKERKSM